RGYTVANGTLAWFDIPYAEPPVGELRWRAPRPLHTPGVARDRSTSRIACPQLPSTTAALDGNGVVGSEDCLYLDVRAPATPGAEPLPVMVWVHGGGNTTGYKGAYDFSRLVAAEQVVVVTLNYRLGPLGWFTHPAIQGEQQGLDASSNFGTLDIIESLRWVQQNIAAFGGDPARVTVFGESAGGHNIYALLASPLAGGLFQRAIVQSGYVTSATPGEAFNAGKADPRITRGSWELVSALGQGNSPTQQEASAAALRALPFQKIIETRESLPDDGTEPLSTADGIVIPREGILAALADPANAKQVPVMAGTTRDEVTLWLATSRYFVDANYPFTRWGPPRLRVRDPALYDWWVSLRSRGWKIRGVDEPLAALERAGYRELHAYRLDWDGLADSFFADFQLLVGAAHGVDVSFLTADWYYGPITRYVYPDTPERDELSRAMMQHWARFAREGKPAEPAAWPAFRADAPFFLRLDSDEGNVGTRESADFESLLAEIADASLPDPLERCMLLWDTLVNVGQPDYGRYAQWNGGECARTDVIAERRRIQAELKQQYGSASVP
ncbi:MAG: carboxylesterase/lipase family protein, partial [Gammaproteobacteria bacterium]